MHDYIVRCMNGFGYEWTTGQARCKKAPLATNPFCYLPRRLFDRLVTEFQMEFELGSGGSKVWVAQHSRFGEATGLGQMS